MKLNEFSNDLSVNEIDSLLLREDFQADMTGDLEKIVTSTVKKPFELFHSQAFKKLEQRLKSWSLPLIYDLEKDPDNADTGYMKTLKKIASDPAKAAKSIFNRVIAKHLDDTK